MRTCQGLLPVYLIEQIVSLSHRDEDVHSPTAQSSAAAQRVPRAIQRVAGVIVYSNACRELQKDHIPDTVLIGFTSLVTQSETPVIVPTKFR